jgi:hypothetical protein
MISLLFQYVYKWQIAAANLFGILATSLSSLTRFGLDEKVDKEKARKEGSEKNGEVGTELNLKSKGGGWEGIDDGIGGESWGSNDSWGNSNGGLEGSC